MRKTLSVIAALALFGFLGCKARTGLDLPAELVDASDGLSVDASHLIFIVRGPQPGLFLFDLSTKSARKLLEGNYATITAMGRSGRAFVAVTTGKTKTVGIVDGDGFMQIPLIPNLSDDEFSFCQASDFIVVCSSEVPGITDGINPMGFTALTVIDVAAQKTWWFRVPTYTYKFQFIPSRGEIWLNPTMNENRADEPVYVSDLKGNLLRRQSSKATTFSPSGKFAVPKLNESGLPWEIYDTATWAPVLKFNQSENNVIDYSFGEWNPVRDFLPIYHCTSDCEIEIYDIAARKVVKKYKTSRDGPGFWSFDGTKFYILRGQRLMHFDID